MTIINLVNQPSTFADDLVQSLRTYNTVHRREMLRKPTMTNETVEGCIDFMRAYGLTADIDVEAKAVTVGMNLPYSPEHLMDALQQLNNVYLDEVCYRYLMARHKVSKTTATVWRRTKTMPPTHWPYSVNI